MAKAVLPILGRAATMMRSDFCRPAVSLSSRAYPVVTPVMRSWVPAMRERLSKTRATSSAESEKSRPVVRWEMAKTACSDSSSRLLTSREAS